MWYDDLYFRLIFYLKTGKQICLNHSEFIYSFIHSVIELKTTKNKIYIKEADKNDLLQLHKWKAAMFS